MAQTPTFQAQEKPHEGGDGEGFPAAAGVHHKLNVSDMYPGGSKKKGT